MRRTSFSLLVAPFVAIGFVACGGANDGGLFGPGGSNPPGVDAGTTLDSSMSSPDAAMSAHDAAPGIDAAPPPPVDAAPPPFDAAPPPKDAGDDPGVRCGDTTTATYCPVPDQFCCRRTLPQPGNSCVNSNNLAGCAAGLAIPCDDTTDCVAAGMSGMVCCAQYDQTGMVTQVSCSDPSQCNAQNQSVQVCNPIQSMPCDDTSLMCCPSSTTLPGYDICKAPSSPGHC